MPKLYRKKNTKLTGISAAEREVTVGKYFTSAGERTSFAATRQFDQ